MRRRRPLDIPHAELAAELGSLVSGLDIAPADAGVFVEAACYHGLTGYAVDAIERATLALPPAGVRRLADVQAKRVLHSALLRRELAAVAGPLNAIGAAPLLVKGPAVADRFYREPALRTFSDLDLLVRRDVLPAAVAALAGAGYTVVGEYRPDYPEALYHDVHMARSLGRHRVDVDLHWRLGDDPLTIRVDHDALARGSEPLDVDGTAISVPAVPEQLLALAVHFLSDVARRLIWVVDLALVARAASEAEWRRTFDLAGRLGLGWPLHRALVVPSRATLEATVGLDGASTPRMLARHVR